MSDSFLIKKTKETSKKKLYPLTIEKRAVITVLENVQISNLLVLASAEFDRNPISKNNIIENHYELACVGKSFRHF